MSPGQTTGKGLAKNKGLCADQNSKTIHKKEKASVSLKSEANVNGMGDIVNDVDKSKKQRKVISRSKISLNSDIKSKLKCINTNAQSLQFKMDELKQVIKDNDVKVVAVTES